MDECCYYVKDIVDYLQEQYRGRKAVPLEELWALLDNHPAPMQWAAGPDCIVIDFQRTFSSLFSGRKGNCFLTPSHVYILA